MLENITEKKNRAGAIDKILRDVIIRNVYYTSLKNV